MSQDGFFVEFFATKFGPKESENDTHKENHDGCSRVSSCRSQRDRWSESESATVGKIFGDTNKIRAEERSQDFFVARFKYCNKTLAPFGMSINDEDITNAFAEKNKGHFAIKTQIFGDEIFFNEDDICENCNKNINKGIEDGFEFDFAAAFFGGKDN